MATSRLLCCRSPTNVFTVAAAAKPVARLPSRLNVRTIASLSPPPAVIGRSQWLANGSGCRHRLLSPIASASVEIIGGGRQQWTRRPMSYVSNINGRASGSSRRKQTVRLLAIGAAIGAVIVGFESVYEYSKVKLSKSRRQQSSAAKLLAAEEVPQSAVSRRVAGPTDLGMTFTLYQYQSCPFCCKVRAFLDYFGIPYNVVEVNPVMRQQLKFSKYRKVPILLIERNGETDVLQINDSTTIVSALASYLISRKPESVHKDYSLSAIANWYIERNVPRDDGTRGDETINKYFLMFGDIQKQTLDRIEGSVAEERNWRLWADDHLVHTLSPNIYRTMSESLRSFRHFSLIGDWDNNFKLWEKYLCLYVGSGAMWLIAKRLKKRHRLSDDVRTSLYDSCAKWTKAVGKDRKFMGGDKPNMADLAVYGVLNSIEGCDAFDDMIDKTRIGKWYYSVQELVKNKAGVNEITFISSSSSNTNNNNINNKSLLTN
ncbi:prostaglandin E synthase 2-like isoform X1 [Oppia nitens]|uniref:prostaglandin E synthase 2-like isoform X1 n=1 Tax=Oppia nitens TaxID=1686743 RepID=UPI0023D9F555|nr:prostaglandin E synthase 2-like isoform X1 [Oppia nitens]